MPAAFAEGGNSASLKGVVKDAAGPVVGATVITKDGATGTTTGIDGSFTLNNVPQGATIVISFIGYQTQEIPYAGQTMLDVTLQEEAATLDAVVVTALGIKRQEKALSYNVQQIKADEITNVKDANFMNSLNGKVAGVTINSSAVGAGGAAKVIMRGVKSISKNNNALYVIDGIPMFNTTTGGTGDSNMGDQPGSEAVADLNPEDIESINMLTGPSAAALYGNAAANGVVLINTRKGSKDKTSVSYSNNTSFSSVYMLPEMQSTYGNNNGAFASWSKVKGSAFGSYDPANFFDTGVNTMNAVTFSTGTAKNQTYVSVATTNANGVIPDNKYERYNFSFRNTASFLKDKMTLDLGGSYIIQKDQNMTASGQYFNPVPSLYLFPRGDSFDEIRMFERWNATRGIYEQFWPYGNMAMALQNPYWIAKRMQRENNKKRYMFNATLSYKILDWLDISARARLDNSDTRYTKKLYASTDPIFAGRKGNYDQTQTAFRSFYGDVMLNINKTFDDWSISANIGASINDKRQEMLGFGGDLRDNNNHFTIHNLNYESKFKPKTDYWHDQSQGRIRQCRVGLEVDALPDPHLPQRLGVAAGLLEQLVVLLSFGGSLGRDFEHGTHARGHLVPQGARLVHRGRQLVRPLPHAGVLHLQRGEPSLRLGGHLPDVRPETRAYEVVGGRSERQVLEPPLDRCYLLPFEHLQSDLQDRPVGRFGLHQSIHPDR